MPVDETPASDAGAGIAKDSSGSVAQGFCPVHGLLGKSPSAQFSEELRCLLRQRLRLAATILAAGMAIFLIRDLTVGSPREFTGAAVMVPYVALTVSMIGLSALLFARSCLSVKQLRIVELLTFGLPAAFFVWDAHCQISAGGIENLQAKAVEFPFRSLIPWLLLIQIYGIFIPNTPRRAAVVTLLMALAPLTGAWAAAAHQPAVAQSLAEGRLSGMVFVLGISVAAAVYGSHRVGRLQRREFEARSMDVYTVRQRLGAGGMGEVYLAEHRLLKRSCAIKVIRPEKAKDDNAIARFESEVQAAARLTHPNTIEIYDYGHTEDGTFYYAMEFLPGLNLQDMVDRYGPLPPERVIYLLRQVCSALGEAHAIGLIHRDIKPGNIFAAERGRLYDVAKLLDFGLVKSITPDAESLKLTMDGTVVGSPLYAAPEATVSDSGPDARTDIYSLGATAYFLLTGQPVFSGSNPVRVLFAHVNQPVVAPRTLRPEIPADLESVVLKCLEKNPADRFADVSQVEQVLSECDDAEKWTQQRAAAWWSETGESSDSVRPSRPGKPAGLVAGPDATTNELAVTAIAAPRA